MVVCACMRDEGVAALLVELLLSKIFSEWDEWRGRLGEWVLVQLYFKSVPLVAWKKSRSLK